MSICGLPAQAVDLEKELKEPKPDLCNDRLMHRQEVLKSSIAAAVREWGSRGTSGSGSAS